MENKIKHIQGNICCEGCYMLGLKDGKQEAKKEFVEFLEYELKIEKSNDWMSELEYLRAVKSHIKEKILQLQEEKNEN